MTYDDLSRLLEEGLDGLAIRKRLRDALEEGGGVPEGGVGLDEAHHTAQLRRGQGGNGGQRRTGHEEIEGNLEDLQEEGERSESGGGWASEEGKEDVELALMT